MSSGQPKQINLNTMLLALVNVLVLVVAFFAKHTLERVESNQAKLWEAMMPRHEVEMQLQLLRSENLRIIGDQQEFRARLGKLELDIARMQKP